MTHFFKPQDYKRAQALLKNNGFYSVDVRDYDVGEIVGRVARQPDLLSAMIQILQELKITPMRILKIQLMVQRLLQTDAAMQENQQLFKLLKHLREKSKKLIKESSSPRKLQDCQDSSSSTKDSVDMNEGFECNDGPTLLLVKIVNPIFQLQERLIFSYDLAYRPHSSMEMDLNMCWATINLLRKFMDISSGMEEIGRYYFKQFSPAIVCLVKTLDNDIQMLYRRVKNFLSRRTIQLQTLWEIGHFSNTENVQSESISEFLLLVEALEMVNHNIQLIYGGRYFASNLMLNKVHMPSLFKYELKIELFYELRKNHCRKMGLRRCSSGRVTPSQGVEYVKEI